MLKFTVPIEPIPQPRPKFGGGKVYQPKRIIEYKEQVKMAAMAAMIGREVFCGELSVTLLFYRRFQPTSRNFGDFDNLAKAICDALNGIVYRDDSQIVRCVIEKHCDKDNPRAEITVRDKW